MKIEKLGPKIYTGTRDEALSQIIKTHFDKINEIITAFEISEKNRREQAELQLDKITLQTNVLSTLEERIDRIERIQKKELDHSNEFEKFANAITKLQCDIKNLFSDYENLSRQIHHLGEAITTLKKNKDKEV